MVIGPHHRAAGQLPHQGEYEAFDLGVPHVDLLLLPATSFHPKSSDDSMLHENVETGTVECESELAETDEVETLGNLHVQ